MQGGGGMPLVDPDELRQALRALTGGGDGYDALTAAQREAERRGGVVPCYRLPTVLAGLRRRAEQVLLSLSLLVPTPDGTGYVVRETTSTAAIDAALAQQAQQRAERAARRREREASEGDGEAQLRRLEAERERKARNKADQRARERGARAPLSPPPVALVTVDVPPVTAPEMSPPVTAREPVTPEPKPVAVAGHVAGDITAALSRMRPGASDPSSPSPEFINLEGKGDPSREVTAPTVTPEPTPAPASVPLIVPPSSPAAGLEGQVREVERAWVAAFADPGTTLPLVTEADRAAVAGRLREPGVSVAHVLAAVTRAARPGSWHRRGDAGRYRLLALCGAKFHELAAEGLQTPAPPASTPTPPGPASVPFDRPDYPAGVEALPADFFDRPGRPADREDPARYKHHMYVFEHRRREWVCQSIGRGTA
jgi:hypothetical protein